MALNWLSAHFPTQKNWPRAPTRQRSYWSVSLSAFKAIRQSRAQPSHLLCREVGGGGWATTPPPPQRFVREEFGKKEKQADRYLGKIAEKLESKGLKVHTDVLFWPPAEAIASYAEQNGADIIVMSSHGRSGVSRWAHGNVAGKVLRASCVPVLMVRAPGCVPGV
jgi:nucleotide-binding universal stress UspA family protein